MIRVLTIIVLLCSCAGPPVQDLERHPVGAHNTTTETVQYLHPELPLWANYSEAGQCRRNETVRFLNLNTLRKSFGFSYAEAIQFQYLYNRQYTLGAKQRESEVLFLGSERQIFYDTTNQIRNRIRPFQIPQYKRVHVIWIDSYLKQKNGKRNLKKLMKSALMQKGHPVWTSFCLGENEFTALQKELGLDEFDIRYLPAAAYSIYGPAFEIYPYLALSFRRFLPQKKLWLFKAGQEMPVGLSGGWDQIKVR